MYSPLIIIAPKKGIQLVISILIHFIRTIKYPKCNKENTKINKLIKIIIHPKHLKKHNQQTYSLVLVFYLG